MNEQEFLSALQDVIQCRHALHMDTPLVSVTAYDSLSKLVLMAYLNDMHKVTVTAAQMNRWVTVEDIYKTISHVA